MPVRPPGTSARPTSNAPTTAMTMPIHCARDARSPSQRAEMIPTITGWMFTNVTDAATVV